jgi:teichoic acid transport system ATP-binding protein
MDAEPAPLFVRNPDVDQWIPAVDSGPLTGSVVEPPDTIPSINDAPVVLQAESVHVRYRVRPRRQVERALIARGQPVERRVRQVHAVQGVSLSVHEGDCLGIIGQNGAGKSSLVRALAGFEPLSAGRVLAAARPRMLGVGSAAKPAWTGWETIDLGLIALGVPRGRRRHFSQEIADFTELGDHLRMPVATYSRGMQARLQFAINTAVPAAILCIDEALGGADGRFRARAEQRIERLLSSSGAIIIVSHSMDLIGRMSSEVVWIKTGRLHRRGRPEEVIAAFKADLGA